MISEKQGRSKKGPVSPPVNPAPLHPLSSGHKGTGIGHSVEEKADKLMKKIEEL